MKKISLIVCSLFVFTACSQNEHVPVTKKAAQKHVDEHQKVEEKPQSKEKSKLLINVPTTKALRIIVNKKNPLSKDYNPGENPDAKKALLQLIHDMQQLGYAVSDSYSGFRPYDYQKTLYDNYVAKDGKVEADRYSARPGFSEHQTGLAFDLIDTSGELLGTGIKDGADEWIAQNAYRYGFVLRYTPETETQTGYMGESWHIRFIGNDAEKIYQAGLTLEEYYDVVGGDYTD